MSTLVISKGEGIHAEIHWRNEDGTPIDITGRALGISEAFPPELEAGTVTLVDAVAGVGLLEIHAELADCMRHGRASWIRLYAQLPDACRDVTPKIWVDVQ